MPFYQTPNPLTQYRLLTFDIYGTLIDWQTGIRTALLSSHPYRALAASSPSTSPLHSSADPALLLAAFAAHERAVQAETPGALYADVLARVYERLYAEMAALVGPGPGATTTTTTTTASSSSSTGDTTFAPATAAELSAASRAFGASVPAWPAFPDTVAAMRRLGARYALAALSNVDMESVSGTLTGPLEGVRFGAVWTAQEIGSYKPDPRNFEFLVERAGRGTGEGGFDVGKEKVLHVAESLFHDHVPARRVGLVSVWVDREGGVMGRVGAEKGEGGEGGAEFAWRVRTLAELADLVDDAFEKEKVAA